MFVVFGETGDGDIEAQFIVDDFPGDVHLSLAAVEEEEVGGRVFAVVALNDFCHGGIVVVDFSR